MPFRTLPHSGGLGRTGRRKRATWTLNGGPSSLPIDVIVRFPLDIGSITTKRYRPLAVREGRQSNLNGCTSFPKQRRRPIMVCLASRLWVNNTGPNGDGWMMIRGREVLALEFRPPIWDAITIWAGQ